MNQPGLWLLLICCVMSCAQASDVPAACDATAAPNATSPLHVKDGFLDDKALRDSLIQYLDAHEPTNPLGVVMVPTPTELFQKFIGALGSLGAASSNAGKFPQLQLAAFNDGSGRFPGKVTSAGSKECHSDVEVDSDFGLDNVVGPTSGRVGILYLSGEGDFILVDEATGEETREEIKPGRFISWSNTGNKHCVATSSSEPRRFLGPVVLDASKAGLIPVVDILMGPEPIPACSTADSTCSIPSTACVNGLCCTPAGSTFSEGSVCCPGAARWYVGGKCCFLVGMSASSASQCCSGRIFGNTCAPPQQHGCLSTCKKAAYDYGESVMTARNCRSPACQEMAAAAKHMHLAWCYAARLPRKC